MFTARELKEIDRNYFRIILENCYAVTLQSMNTGHYWHIMHQEYPTFTSCKIQHKHRQTLPFHEQGSAPTLEKAIEKIKAHDLYHLCVRLPKRKPTRLGTHQKGQRTA